MGSLTVAATSAGALSMTFLTRRGALATTLGAALAGGAASARAEPGHERGQGMDIERYQLTPVVPGIPRISSVVARGDMVYVSGVTANPGSPPDVKVQTTKALQRIDALLAEAGATKADLLTAQVWLTDMANFAAHNDAWNAWVDHAHPPVRACLLSPQLWRPELLVEIMVTAGRPRAPRPA